MAGKAVPLDARLQGTSCFAILESHSQISKPPFKHRSKLKSSQGEQFTSYMTRQTDKLSINTEVVKYHFQLNGISTVQKSIQDVIS